MFLMEVMPASYRATACRASSSALAASIVLMPPSSMSSAIKCCRPYPFTANSFYDSNEKHVPSNEQAFLSSTLTEYRISILQPRVLPPLTSEQALTHLLA